MLFILKALGRLCALLPESLVRAACVCLGWGVACCMRRRRRTTLGDLRHAYPEKSERWRRRVFRESCARLFEMALFLPASAYFSSRRLDRAVAFDDEMEQFLSSYCKGGGRHGRPAILLLPHMTMAEAGTLLPRWMPAMPELKAIFRPLNQPAVNAWVTAQRERFGAKLLSRREGYNGAMATLREGGIVAVLFDQDASGTGTTVTFMDRVARVTDLPGLLAKRFNADVYVMLLERQGFWKSYATLHPLPSCKEATEVAIRSHIVLESYLRRDANAAADWLWLHDRWGCHYRPGKRFNLKSKRQQLDLDNRIRGRSRVPRKTRLWVRLPNWLGDVVMTVPLLRAIRAGRPDFELTLIGKAAFQPLVSQLGVADNFLALLKQGPGYFPAFYRLRLEYPDTFLLFTNSLRGDLEAWTTGCLQRFGMLRPGKRRPFLSDPYVLPPDVDEAQAHQVEVWEKMLRSYGLKEALDFTPLAPADEAEESPEPEAGRVVGLICGTENAPEKRWPVCHWRTVVQGLLDSDSSLRIRLFGTANDRSITSRVVEGFPEERVRNSAGETDLPAFMEGLRACRVVVCNDTGGMHLANLLGTPVVAAFGPTNPVRTGPVFEAPVDIVQPDGCLPTGGGLIENVPPERVLSAARAYLCPVRS
ncbi:MAG: glycosyltransferase family 9 protein [Opitutales bacterium]